MVTLQNNRAYTPPRGGPGAYATNAPVSGRSEQRELRYWVVRQAHRPIFGTDSPRQIFRASTSGISVCRGIASTAPVVGLVHRECDRPSRFKWQPCCRRWRSSRPASPDDDLFAPRRSRYASQTVFAAVLKDEPDRFGQALQRRRFRSALPVGTGNLRTIRDVPAPCSLNNRSELVPHLSS